MRTNIVAMALLVGLACPTFAGDDAECWRELSVVRDAYRKALNRVRTEYPLTWESMASQPEYDGVQRIGLEYANQTLCAPHTWHAAEAFLYLIEAPQ